MVSSVVLGVGLALVGFAVGEALRRGPSPTTAPQAYMSATACPACPSDARIRSVEVQARAESTLFILRGNWPASIDSLSTDVRLMANDLTIVLKPHGSNGAFEIPTATSGAKSLPSGSVAAGFQQGAFLIDVSSTVLGTPVLFDVGLWDGTRYLERIPSSGELTWTGSGASNLLAEGSASPSQGASATISSPPSPTPSGLDLTALAGACETIPSGTVPRYLQMGRLASFGPEKDPRTGELRRRVATTLAASALDKTPPYSIVAIILPPGATPPTGQQRAVDRAGTVQLWLFSNGSDDHKGIRTYRNGSWTMVLDKKAEAMTFYLSSTGVAFYWSGLNPGYRFGFITASGNGCAANGLSRGLVPEHAVS